MKKVKDYREEYVSINGIKEYLLHYPTDANRPILLFLHGGPGQSEALFAYEMQKQIGGLCTVVHYDQRGAGKTYAKNPKAYPTAKILLFDLHQTVQYLKRKYHKNKIIILGHSWGSILGSLYCKKYPDQVECYIGVGQVIDIFVNETAAYKKLKETIEEKGNQKDQEKLEKIGEYPLKKFDHTMMKKLVKVRSLQQKYNLASGADLSIYKMAFKSPILQFSDVVSMLKAQKINRQLFLALGKFNLYHYSLEYKVPIYYILGDKDFQTPYKIAEAYQRRVEAPDKHIFMIRDAGHSPMLEQPRQFAGALKEIIESRLAYGDNQ